MELVNKVADDNLNLPNVFYGMIIWNSQERYSRI